MEEIDIYFSLSVITALVSQLPFYFLREKCLLLGTLLTICLSIGAIVLACHVQYLAQFL